ncbi:hypothetical protein CGLO_17670 [Colletotrichum gloeosporioides Cg-14]|uniref:Uncharacterized protein n=1 Tax=Colletotrichum gloeosporioides (strain Cg-14) TaxID=1237896 RepID=T0L5U2_COLGC|nr:hypothetical protein CGLO_17670 [Colletotrichum gloeosporioides Cg-14]
MLRGNLITTFGTIGAPWPKSVIRTIRVTTRRQEARSPDWSIGGRRGGEVEKWSRDPWGKPRLRCSLTPPSIDIGAPPSLRQFMTDNSGHKPLRGVSQPAFGILIWETKMPPLLA